MMPGQSKRLAEAPHQPVAARGGRAIWVESVADRRALLVTPASGRPRGLLVELHGSGLDIKRHRRMTGLAEMLVPQRLAVLLPQAARPFRSQPALEPGYAWNIPGAPLPGASEVDQFGADDIGWITSLVQSVQSDLDLAARPLFLTGYSGGARLASHLLVRAELDWSAAALVAGLRTVDNATCAPAPTISFHGVDDAINPYAGGLGPRWDLGVEAAGHRYALAQGCLPKFEERDISGARCRTYRTANGMPALTLYAVLNCAHAWPGCGDVRHLEAFGPGGSGIDASSVIAEFFTSHVAACEQSEEARDVRA